MNQSSGGYKGIFKSTFLFGFVQVFHIITKVAINKTVAIILGAEGLGIISLYITATGMLRSGCGLGIKQSAVRDVAEANEEGNVKKIAEIISVTNKVVLFTAFLGLIVTIIGSPLLSNYSFGSSKYIIPFIVLSVAVALNIYAEGQMAIITGMRRLRDLAKVNIIGSFVGMLSSIPFYIFLGQEGIVPSLIISALCLFIVTKIFVHRIKIDHVKLTMSESFKKAKPMVQMGCVLMIAGFAGLVIDLLVSSFIRFEGGFETVGYFQAGSTIISGYFGIVLTAMTTDYYPRICGVNKDNGALNEELNKQVTAGIIMVFPLAVCFVFLAPLFVTFLYSNEFAVSIQFTDLAIFGTILIIAANSMGMIFMAKMASTLYLILVSIALLCQLFVSVLSYHYWGLRGLGFSYTFNGINCILLYGVILYKKYRVSLNKSNIVLIILVLITVAITLMTRRVSNRLISHIIGGVIIVGSTAYSLSYLKNKIGIDLVKVVKGRLL